MTTGPRLRRDDSMRRLDGGRMLIGGSPLWVLRLSETGARLVDGWLSGTPVGGKTGERGAALVVRTAALHEHDGFDERMRFGQDVDFVWRLATGGADVRFEPESVVGHAPRTSWSRWLRQRFEYGTTAAPLALRHGSAVVPAPASSSTLCGRPGVSNPARDRAAGRGAPAS